MRLARDRIRSGYVLSGSNRWVKSNTGKGHASLPDDNERLGCLARCQIPDRLALIVGVQDR